MIRRLALAAILGLSSAVNAAQLSGSLVLSASNVLTTDLFCGFCDGRVYVDVYHVVVDNPYAFPATSVGLSLPRGDGPVFIDHSIPNTTFRATASLPVLGPITVASSFFVVPDPSKIVATDTTDSWELLASNFTTQDGAALVPAGGSSVLAVLSVETGSPAPSMLNWTGNATINGVTEPILFVPEPTSGVLAGLALVGAAARRRV